MNTTTEFLEGVKAAYGLTSDYKLAKFLGISTASISRLMQKKDFLGDENAIKVANLLKIAPAYVLSCVHFERAKKAEEKAVWQSIIEKFGGLAASVLLGVALFGSVPDFADAQSRISNSHQYTLCERQLCFLFFAVGFLLIPFFPRFWHIFPRR